MIANINDLLAFVMGHPMCTKIDMQDGLGWSPSKVNQTIIGARRELEARGSTMALDADRPGHGGPWLYFLTGDFTEGKEFILNRAIDAQGRLVSLSAQVAPFVLNTTKRTREGKQVRMLEHGVGQALSSIEIMLDVM